MPNLLPQIRATTPSALAAEKQRELMLGNDYGRMGISPAYAYLKRYADFDHN